MNVKIVTLSHDTIKVYLKGEIDHHASLIIREDIDKYIDNRKIKNILFDFKDVSFMDSSGIGFIMGSYKLIQLYEGSLEIINISDTINRVIKLSGIDKLNIKISVNQR